MECTMDNALNQFREEVNDVLVLCKEAYTAMNIFNTLSALSPDSEYNDIINYLAYSEFFHAFGIISKVYDKDKNALGIPKLLNKYQTINTIYQNYAEDINIQAMELLMNDYITSLEQENNHPLTTVKIIRDKIWAHNDKKYGNSKEKLKLLESLGSFEESIFFSLTMADLFLNAFYHYDSGEKFDLDDTHCIAQLNTIISKLKKDTDSDIV